MEPVAVVTGKEEYKELINAEIVQLIVCHACITQIASNVIQI